jgi:hypothetical protein
MKGNLQSLNNDMDIEFVEAPQVKGRPGRISESFVVRSQEVDQEEQGVGEQLSPAAMSEAEGDEFGPLAAELEELLEWIDVVDPETAQVTRRPILKETALFSADDQTAGIEERPGAENPEGSSGQENCAEDLIATENRAAEAPPALSGETVLIGVQAAEVSDAMAEIVGYLLSPEGAQLRRQARSAAYSARKAAYAEAHQEIQPLIEEAQKRLAEASAPTVNKVDNLDERALSTARNANQAAKRQAEESQRQFQVTQAAYEQAASRVHQVITLVEMGKAPALLAQGLEENRLELASEMLAAWARRDRAQVELERDKRAVQELESSLRSNSQEQEAHFLERKAEIEKKLSDLKRRLKERQDEIAAGVPEVVLWKAAQAERRRREDEQAAKLIEQLASQGIRKTLHEAARLGIHQNPSLQSAISERQKRVNFLIDFCREKAETLAAFPEVLPEGAHALLVRGDAIRVVDAAGRELAVLYANGEGTELHTVLRVNGRRWKFAPGQDCWVVKK